MPLISAYLCTQDGKFTGRPSTYTGNLEWGWDWGGGQGGDKRVVEEAGGVGWKFPHSPLATRSVAGKASRMCFGLQQR